MQQDDPLGPLFSLVLSQFFETIEVPDDILLHLWFLDDGCIVDSRTVIAHFLTNARKWPSIGPTFQF